MAWWGEEQEKNKLRIFISRIWRYVGKYNTGNNSCLCPALQAKGVLEKKIKQKSPTAL